jgi:hypothetical protein
MTGPGGIVLIGVVDQGNCLTTLDDRGSNVLAVCLCRWTYSKNTPVTFCSSRELQRRFDADVIASGKYQPTRRDRLTVKSSATVKPSSNTHP